MSMTTKVTASIVNGRLKVYVDLKFNPNHDPASGQFSSGGGAMMGPDTGGGFGGGSSDDSKPKVFSKAESKKIISSNNGLFAVSLDVGQFRSFEDFCDDGLNTPGGRRWPEETAGVQHKVNGKKQDYELRLININDAKPNQFGEDYINDSSRNTAERIRDLRKVADRVSSGDLRLGDEVRLEDLTPIVLQKDGTIVDGNHRHAAATMNGDSKILAFVAAGNGSGKIKNLKNAYEALSQSDLSKIPYGLEK